ncbi:Isochorismatase family protein (plasmid) [Roseomonas mucosa]|uniref:cysteine hydrolase family protein n=1 Tax=Roseomonas mucosa TaxID=207340 RepID=UPI0022011E66|nr:isochorismatase family protein [Roseomonas mucosa]QDJ11593.1 Isochorismatase family protein [Roseomonas mucosa]
MWLETTAREAADRGYAVTLVEDACGTTHADLHASTLRNFSRLFGRVRTTDDILAEFALAAAPA